MIYGAKRQTRRVIKPQPMQIGMFGRWAYWKSKRTLYATDTWMSEPGMKRGIVQYCPYGGPGDKLYSRETWRPYCIHGQTIYVQYKGDLCLHPIQIPPANREDIVNRGWELDGPWHPSIFQFAWMSRLHLTLTHVKAERVQDITDEDAKREGIRLVEGQYYSSFDLPTAPTAVGAYRILWDAINKDRGFGWDENPLTWVLDYDIDYVLEEHPPGLDITHESK
jgi:hypothetical protein